MVDNASAACIGTEDTATAARPCPASAPRTAPGREKVRYAAVFLPVQERPIWLATCTGPNRLVAEAFVRSFPLLVQSYPTDTHLHQRPATAGGQPGHAMVFDHLMHQHSEALRPTYITRAKMTQDALDNPVEKAPRLIHGSIVGSITREVRQVLRSDHTCGLWRAVVVGWQGQLMRARRRLSHRAAHPRSKTAWLHPPGIDWTVNISNPCADHHCCTACKSWPESCLAGLALVSKPISRQQGRDFNS